MKIRHGFVSNSSSSSFVIAKDKMTKEQIEKFSAWVNKHNEEACEGYVYDEKHYFVGTIGNGCDIDSILDALGVDDEYVSITC